MTHLLPGSARRALAQRRGLAETAHRPWPLPEGRWVIGQSWNHLLFAHWPISAGQARRLVPPPLEPDLHEGRAFAAEYGPAGPASEPRPGTLEHWLTERYCFYTVRGGRPWRTEVHHPP